MRTACGGQVGRLSAGPREFLHGDNNMLHGTSCPQRALGLSPYTATSWLLAIRQSGLLLVASGSSCRGWGKSISPPSLQCRSMKRRPDNELHMSGPISVLRSRGALGSWASLFLSSVSKWRRGQMSRPGWRKKLCGSSQTCAASDPAQPEA